jgi:hypothetical protein
MLQVVAVDEELVKVLNSAGKETCLYNSPDGSEVLILSYGGRLLGLFAPGSSDFFFGPILP